MMTEGDECSLTRTRSRSARRVKENIYHRLVKELTLEDSTALSEWIILDRTQHQHLLRLVTPLLEKQDTITRQAVSVGKCLTLTLSYLATGESEKSLSLQFGVNPNHVCSIIPEVCQAIYQVLQPHYLKVPTTQKEWLQIAHDYFSLWNFPMCIGVLDGKRIVLEKTANSEAQFYEYKGKTSIVLLSVVDANYKFIYVDVGAGGALNPAGIWDRCSMRQALEMAKNVLNIPRIDNLPFSDEQCPFVLVGDDAFPLKGYLMKSYRARELTEECKIFNYRLSRARKSSENAYGILAARFQVFKSPIRTSPTNAIDFTLAAVTLHNYLRVCSRESYMPADILDLETQNAKIPPGQCQLPFGGLESLPVTARCHAVEAKQIREKFKEYFIREGRVPWQESMC